jgi:hypothetical protein
MMVLCSRNPFLSTFMPFCFVKMWFMVRRVWPQYGSRITRLCRPVIVKAHDLRIIQKDRWASGPLLHFMYRRSTTFVVGWMQTPPMLVHWRVPRRDLVEAKALPEELKCLERFLPFGVDCGILVAGAPYSSSSSLTSKAPVPVPTTFTSLA